MTSCIASSPRISSVLAFFLHICALPSTIITHNTASFAVDLNVRRENDAPTLLTNPDFPTNLEREIKQYIVDLDNMASRYSLVQAVEIGLTSNPWLQRQYQQFQSISWRTIATRREWLPSLSFSSTLGLQSRTTEAQRTQMPRSLSSNQFDLRSESIFRPIPKFSWSLINFSRSSLLQSQKAELMAQSLRVRQSARDLMLNIQTEYYNIQRIRKAQAIKLTIKKICLDIANIITTQSNESDQRQANSILARAASSESALLSQQQQATARSAQLSGLLAQPSNSYVLPSDNLIPSGEWRVNLDQSLLMARENREEIQISTLTSSSLSDQASAAMNRYLPEISLDAVADYKYNQYELRKIGQTTEVGNGLNTDVRAVMSLNWKFFDSGVSAAQATALRKSAQALLNQSSLDLLQAESQVKTAYADYVTQLLQFPIIARELNKATRALEILLSENPLGSQDYSVRLIQSVDQYEKAAEKWFEVQANYNISLAKLHRVTSTWPNEFLSVIRSGMIPLDGINLDVQAY